MPAGTDILTMHGIMKIALVQSGIVWGDVTANLRRFGEKVERCGGCDIILLPEMFASGGMTAKGDREKAAAEKRRAAERFGEIRETMQSWASRSGAVVCGSAACETEGSYYNRLIVARPGEGCLYYDKRHCFRMGGENEHFSAGSRHLDFEFRGVRISTFICYDLRFPVWSRNTRGYDVAVYVANWPASRREVWRTLLRARAVENQAFVAGVNCVGRDGSGVAYAGDSMVVDAGGRVLVSGQEYREEVVTAECDMSALRESRRRFPVLDDRDRFDVRV